MKVLLAYGVPVPVGHQVVVRWYHLRQKNRGLFGSGEDTFETRPYLPMVEDLDTGIVHCPDWMLETPSVRTSGEFMPVSEGPRRELEVEKMLRGRVTACRIVTIRRAHHDVQTELTVEPQAEGYRQG